MILIVEDHEESRYVLTRLLAANGYDTIAVSDGVQALLFLETHKPELVILDCHMPCLDGVSVLRAVRSNPRLSDLPMLMFSSDPKAEDEATRAGANGFILKGLLDWSVLSRAIGKYAAKKQRGNASPGCGAEGVGTLIRPQ